MKLIFPDAGGTTSSTSIPFFWLILLYNNGFNQRRREQWYNATTKLKCFFMLPFGCKQYIGASILLWFFDYINNWHRITEYDLYCLLYLKYNHHRIGKVQYSTVFKLKKKKIWNVNQDFIRLGTVCRCVIRIWKYRNYTRFMNRTQDWMWEMAQFKISLNRKYTLYITVSWFIRLQTSIWIWCKNVT